MTKIIDAILNFLCWLGKLPDAMSRAWASSYEKGGGFLTATLIGWGIELLYGLTTQGFVGGMKVFCILWFASGAAFFIGTIGGFLFGIPRVKTNTTVGLASSSHPIKDALDQSNRSSGGYGDNTNLQEVSDWLTKIIIGIGLAQFRTIMTFIGQIGGHVGMAVDPMGHNGGKVIAVGSMVVGFATGFLYYYVWARVILRKSLDAATKTDSVAAASSSAATVAPA